MEVGQSLIKAAWGDAPLALRDFCQSNKQFWTCHYENSTCHHENLNLSLMMKISTVHHKNLDCSPRRPRPFIMKISTIHHETLDRSRSKSRPFIKKISTVHHETLDHSSWKSRPFEIKSPPLVIQSWPFITKINLIFWSKWRSINFIFIWLSENHSNYFL